MRCPPGAAAAAGAAAVAAAKMQMFLVALIAFLLFEKDTFATSTNFLPVIGFSVPSDPTALSRFFRKQLAVGKQSNRYIVRVNNFPIMNELGASDHSSLDQTLKSRKQVLDFAKNALLSRVLGGPLLSGAEEGGPVQVGRCQADPPHAVQNYVGQSLNYIDRHGPSKGSQIQ